MYREMHIKKLTETQKERIKNLGIDYGFEVGLIGGQGFSGFVLERHGKTFSVISYQEYRNSAVVEIQCNFNVSQVNKKTMARVNELSEGTQKLIDAFERAGQSSRARISGDGVWRSRIS